MEKAEIIDTSNTEMVTISRAEYEEKNARLAAQDERISRMENQIAVLTEALRLSRHKRFSASSEKTIEEVIEQLSFLFNEAEVFAEVKAESENVVVPEHKRHKKHEYTLDDANLPENIPTEVVEGWTDHTPAERYKERLKQAKPVLDAMLSWANSRTAAPKSALGKAFIYLKDQWSYLTNYLKDGRLELSNNRAERSIKPFVIDRKNFLFANTPKGATGSAVIFSMIQTAIENGLEPYRYLTWLMKTANTADLTDPQTMQALLPWNAPDTCHSN